MESPRSPRQLRPFQELAILRIGSSRLFYRLNDGDEENGEQGALQSVTVGKKRKRTLRALSPRKKYYFFVYKLTLRQRARHGLSDASNKVDTTTETSNKVDVPRLCLSLRHTREPTGSALPRRSHRRVTLSNGFTLLYTRKYCSDSQLMHEFLAKHDLQPVREVNATSSPIAGVEALEVARAMEHIFAVKNGRVHHLKKGNLGTARTIRSLLVDEAGLLRAPAVIVASRLFIGFNEQVLRESIFFGSFSKKAKEKGRRRT